MESLLTNQEDVSAPVILVGNKQDLHKTGKRQVEQKEVMADWVDTGEVIDYIETSANTLKNISNLFESIAEQASDFQKQQAENDRLELQDQFSDIHDIQSQLLLPNKRYTAAAQRNSNLRYSNMKKQKYSDDSFEDRNSRHS